MITPTIWQDPDFGTLDSDAKVMFFGLISNADDEGRLRGHVSYLKSVIFTYSDLSSKKVQKIRDEIVSKMKNVVLYSVGGEEYIQLKNWDKYQKQREDRLVKSEFPSPNDGQVVDIVLSNGIGMPAEVKLVEVKRSKEKLEEGAAGAATPKVEAKNFFEFMGNPENPEYALFAQNFHEQSNIPLEILHRELAKFVNYWTELDSTGRKQRWEKQPVFEVKKRLLTWFSRVGQFAKPKGKVIV